eukprot:m.214881 g.214881  ORF g.214881 m.214881 type:complete len:330 (-) comp27416_c0_seq1:54-1043(-)
MAANLNAGGLQPWLRGLFTHEDPWNVHKMFGIPCLFHFAYRTLQLVTGEMHFSRGTWTTLALILMHACLSCSSLVFRLPKIRIKEGTRIWPEFRLHSIVFAWRSLVCMLIVWYEDRYPPPAPRFWLNTIVVFATLLAADAATLSLDPKSRSSTIRDLDTEPAMKMTFSLMQFIGTVGCLIGQRTYTAHFVVVGIIQTFAFILTLRRKNLVTHRQTLIIYAWQLGVGMLVANMDIIRWGGMDTIFMAMSLGSAAYLLRTQLGLNKYILWSIMAVVVHFGRRTLTLVVAPAERIREWPAWGWAAALALFGGLALLCIAREAVRYRANTKTE